MRLQPRPLRDQERAAHDRDLSLPRVSAFRGNRERAELPGAGGSGRPHREDRLPAVHADSGNRVEHHFCPDCGSPLFGNSSGMPDAIAFRAATLDDPTWFRPQFHIFTASAQPWAQIPADVPSFPQMPPMVPAPEHARR